MLPNIAHHSHTPSLSSDIIKPLIQVLTSTCQQIRLSSEEKAWALHEIATIGTPHLKFGQYIAAVATLDAMISAKTQEYNNKLLEATQQIAKLEQIVKKEESEYEQELSKYRQTLYLEKVAPPPPASLTQIEQKYNEDRRQLNIFRLTKNRIIRELPALQQAGTLVEMMVTNLDLTPSSR